MELLNDDSWLISVAVFSTFATQNVPVIFDMGASLLITPYSADFIVPPTAPQNVTKLGGMAVNLDMMGVGTVSWTFIASDGSENQIHTLAYWVPNAKARLLSPQKLFKKSQGVLGRYEGDEDTFNLYLKNHPPIKVEYDDRSSLPIGYAHTGAVPEPQVNVALINENENLSEGQKLLLEWRNRFGHLNFPRFQQVLRHVPFIAKKFGPAVRCDAPKCHTCEIAKAKRRARKSTLQTKVTERDGALASGHVKVGARVSVDHFESRLQGRTYDSYGKPSSTKFVGGALFVDHASGMIHCEHQVGFSSVETIRAKQSYERLCMENGVVVQDYLTDSSAFKAKKSVSHIHETQQLLRYCGTNAHHPNGVA
jgi:hypothetical protein